MLKNRRRQLTVFAYLLTVGVLAAYVYWNRDDLSSLSSFSPLYLGACVAGTLSNWITSGVLQLIILQRLGSPVRLRECISLAILGSAANLLMPLQGGAAVRAVYLNRLHGFPFSRFLAAQLGVSVLAFMMSAASASAATGWLCFVEQNGELLPAASGAMLCLVGSVIAMCVPALSLGSHWFSRKLAVASEGWRVLWSAPRFLVASVLLCGWQTMGTILVLWGAYAAVGIRMSAVEITAISCVGSLSGVFVLTPGNVGIYEAVVAYVGRTVNIVPAQSVIVSIVSRSVLVLLVAILTPLALAILSWRTVSQLEHT